jgi:hypothetical protein
MIEAQRTAMPKTFAVTVAAFFDYKVGLWGRYYENVKILCDSGFN